MKKGIADAMTDRIGEVSPNLGHTVASNILTYNTNSRIFLKEQKSRYTRPAPTRSFSIIPPYYSVLISQEVAFPVVPLANNKSHSV